MRPRHTTKRIAEISLATITLAACLHSPCYAQSDDLSGLKGLNTVSVLVEQLPPGAKLLGLVEGTLQTDVELKLRLAGMRVVTQAEDDKISGRPFVYVSVNVTENAKAVAVAVQLVQDTLLLRNGSLAPSAITWSSSEIGTNPTAESVRSQVKDHVDGFLNAWLAANPKAGNGR